MAQRSLTARFPAARAAACDGRRPAHGGGGSDGAEDEAAAICVDGLGLWTRKQLLLLQGALAAHLRGRIGFGAQQQSPGVVNSPRLGESPQPEVAVVDAQPVATTAGFFLDEKGEPLRARIMRDDRDGSEETTGCGAAAAAAADVVRGAEENDQQEEGAAAAAATAAALEEVEQEQEQHRKEEKNEEEEVVEVEVEQEQHQKEEKMAEEEEEEEEEEVLSDEIVRAIRERVPQLLEVVGAAESGAAQRREAVGALPYTMEQAILYRSLS
jgi:hypothetical protein